MVVHLVFQSVALSRLAVERYPLRDSRASNSKHLRNGTASAPYVPLLPSWLLSMQSQKISVKWDLYRYIKVSEVWSMDDLAIFCDHVFCRQRKRDRRNSVDAGGSCLRNLSVQDERREREFKRRVQFVLLHGATRPHWTSYFCSISSCQGNGRVCSSLASKIFWGVLCKGVGIGPLRKGSGVWVLGFPLAAFGKVLAVGITFWESSGCGSEMFWEGLGREAVLGPRKCSGRWGLHWKEALEWSGGKAAPDKAPKKWHAKELGNDLIISTPFLLLGTSVELICDVELVEMTH